MLQGRNDWRLTQRSGWTPGERTSEGTCHIWLSNMRQRTPTKLIPKSFSIGSLPQIRNTALGERMPSSFTTQVEMKDSLLARRKVFDDIGETSQSLLNQSCAEPESSLMEKLIIARNHRVRKRKKQKVKSQTFEAPSQSLTLVTQSSCQGYWEVVSDEEVRPGAREGAAMAACGSKVVLLGGSGRQIYSDLWVFAGEYQHWLKVDAHSHELIPRTGHSLVESNQQLVVFGGETSSLRLAAHRECLNTVALLNTGIMDFRSVSTAGHSVVMRRYHCAAEVGKHLFVHGGLTEKNQVLDDVVVLNLTTWKWRKVETVGEALGSRAFHTAVGVFQFQHKGIVSERRAKEYGVYIFGGRDSQGTCYNSLHIVHLNSRPYTSSVPLTLGEPPEPRFQHTMTHFPELCMVVVYGGRQESRTTSGYRCFGSVHLLRLDTLTWNTTSPRGAVPESRCAHAAAALGSRLVIFGGLHNSHYASNETFVLELQPDRVAELLARDKEKEERKAQLDLLRMQVQFEGQEKELLPSRSRLNSVLKKGRHASTIARFSLLMH